LNKTVKRRAAQELGVKLFVLDDGWLSGETVRRDYCDRMGSEHLNYNKQTPQREPAYCFA
jgi:alpha-galactosidase